MNPDNLFMFLLGAAIAMLAWLSFDNPTNCPLENMECTTVAGKVVCVESPDSL